MKKETLAVIYIFLGAACWGTTGFFVNIFSQMGLTPLQIACVRIGSGAIIFSLFVIAKDRKSLAFALKDTPYFVGTGVISLSLFTWCNFNAITLSSMSVASVLLYTSPIFVLILAVLIFKETLTLRKMAAVLCTFCGCVLVSGFLEGPEQQIPLLAVIFGIGSGLAYALYSIFGTLALGKYAINTVLIYTFTLSFITLLPFSQIQTAAPILISGYTPALCLAFGLFSTVIPYTLYTKGLSHIEASKAATMATMEPIVASCIGVFYFGDILTPVKLGGIILILTAVVLISLHPKK